jgi:hypothetical protein
MEIDVLAVTALASETFVAVDEIVTEPADEVTVAFVAVEIWPEPEIEILPVARMAPVGATDVPPEIEIIPAVAVSDPAPS